MNTPTNSPEVDITFFVACYNESENITATLDMLADSLSGFSLSWEALVIDDASSDNSAELVEKYAREHPLLNIQLIVNKENKGLGTNYIDGSFLGKGKYYRLICGDNVELKENMVKILNSLGKADIIITNPVESTGRSAFRQVLSGLFTWLVNMISGYRIHYYNGLAVHSRYNVMRWHGNYHGFGFQADLITRLLDEGATYIEVPVVARDRTKGNSKAITLSNFLSVAHFLMDLMIRKIGQIFFNHRKRQSGSITNPLH